MPDGHYKSYPSKYVSLILTFYFLLDKSSWINFNPCIWKPYAVKRSRAIRLTALERSVKGALKNTSIIYIFSHFSKYDKTCQNMMKFDLIINFRDTKEKGVMFTIFLVEILKRCLNSINPGGGDHFCPRLW